MIPRLILSNGCSIPAIGYSCGPSWYYAQADAPSSDLASAFIRAYDSGFRHFDVADFLNIGKKLTEAIRGVDRAELFITTKLTPGSGEDIQMHFESSLKQLGLEYVDLYLLHSPSGVDFVSQWQELERIHKDGRAKAIGVANFRVSDLETILKVATVLPVVHEIEYQSCLQDPIWDIISFCTKHGIRIAACLADLAPFSSLVLSKGIRPFDRLLNVLSAKYRKDPGQILLRWVYENSIISIITAQSADHIIQALGIFSFALEAEDHDLITRRLGRSIALQGHLAQGAP